MTIKHILFTFLLLSTTGTLSAQNRPAPAYLMTQNFPDSVLSTVLYSIDGKPTEFSQILKQLKGKTIVLDFWASWCRDCLISIPEYNDLLKKINTEDVVFLLLSVDQDETKWKSAIDRFSLKGTHYRFDLGWKNPLSNYIDLDWIPRYVVIDDKGKIIKPKTIHIDDEELYNVLTTSSNK